MPEASVPPYTHHPILPLPIQSKNFSGVPALASAAETSYFHWISRGCPYPQHCD